MCRRGAGRRGTSEPQTETRRKMMWQEDAATSGAFWTNGAVDVSTDACEQGQLGNVGGNEAFVGEFSERDLDRQITRLARQKVSKLEGGQAGASRSSVRAAGEKTPHPKKEVELQTFGLPRGCPVCTVVIVETGSQSHSAECRTMMEQLMRRDAGGGGGRPSTSSSGYGTRCVNAAPDREMEKAEKASSSHELKKIRLMKRGQVRKAGDSQLEDHNVAVKEIVQMQRRTLELVGGLGCDAGERDLFLRKIQGKAGSIERPQVEEVCVGLCSTSRLRMLYLDHLCMHRFQLCKVSMTRSSVRTPFVKAEVKRLEFCCAVYFWQWREPSISFTNTHWEQLRGKGGCFRAEMRPVSVWA